MNDEIDILHPYKINMLMALTGLALGREADQLAQPMFELIRRFRPESPRLDSFEGWFCMRRGDMVGATRHLTAAVEALGSEAGASRTLLAMVLCAQGDPSWLAQAQAVIDEGVDPHGVFLMKSLRGDSDAEPVPEPVPDAPVQSIPRVETPGMLAEGPASTGDVVIAAPAVTATNNVDRRMVFLRG